MMDDLHEYLNEFFDLGKPRKCAVGENWFVPVKDDMFLQLIPAIKIVYGPECKKGDNWFFESEHEAWLACAAYYIANEQPFPYHEELLKALQAYPLVLEEDDD